jgi:hypothetical protein
LALAGAEAVFLPSHVRQFHRIADLKSEFNFWNLTRSGALAANRLDTLREEDFALTITAWAFDQRRWFQGASSQTRVRSKKHFASAKRVEQQLWKRPWGPIPEQSGVDRPD